MSDEFIKWAGRDKACGVYYDPVTKKYTSVISDLKGISFKTQEELEDWLGENS